MAHSDLEDVPLKSNPGYHLGTTPKGAFQNGDKCVAYTATVAAWMQCQ